MQQGKTTILGHYFFNQIRRFSFLDASRFFICLFLIFFPFQIRTLIYSEPLFLSGNFNIYTSDFLYAADLFMIIAFVCWTVSLKKEKITNRINFGEEKFTFLLLVFLIIMLANSFFATDKLLHLLKTFRFIELFLLYLLIINNVIRSKTAVIIFILSMSFQALAGIFQYFMQSSLGLQFFGEPIVTAKTFGIGKIDIDGQKIIRAFGTFPHANVLGGSLFAALVLNFIYFRRNAWIYWPFAILLGAGMLLTFSRSAFLALITVFLVYISFSKSKIPVRSILLILTLALFFIVIFGLENIILRRLFWENINGNLINIFQERNLYLTASKNMLLDFPFGVGLGRFTANIQQLLTYKLMPWQYQPVHNIFLLAANELGIIGGGTFLGLFAYLFYNFAVKCRDYASGIQLHYAQAMLGMLAGITIIGIFDHYLFSLYQGQILLFLYFALASSFLSNSWLPARNS